MPKEIIPRTAVTPNGGIYRIERRNKLQVEDLGTVDGKQHWRVKEDFTYHLPNDTKVVLKAPNWAAIDNLPEGFGLAPTHQHEDQLTGTLQFMWDAMPLEMKQEIVARYHPHNCVKKGD